jgi:hypothetical protein
LRAFYIFGQGRFAAGCIAHAPPWQFYGSTVPTLRNESMSSIRQWVDRNGHQFGCTEFCSVAIPAKSHADLFCDCHVWAQPKILANGTDIAWPAGWTDAQALAWRADHGLAAPTPV